MLTYLHHCLRPSCRREHNVTVRRIADPTFQFEGAVAARTYPVASVSTSFSYGIWEYDPITEQMINPIQVLTVALYSSPLTLFILGNTTDAGGRQRIMFTLSRCIADGNPMGFCDRLRSRTSPLFIACVHARRSAQHARRCVQQVASNHAQPMRCRRCP